MTMRTKNNKLISNELLKELINYQKKDIPTDKKLTYTDLKRICKYLSNSIFDKNSCSLWNGYVTNGQNFTKGLYINFYFRNKKVALHRLLFNNFVEILKDDEYLKFVCENKGRCCNINHLKKYKYQSKEACETNKSENPDLKIISTQDNEYQLCISFD